MTPRRFLLLHPDDTVLICCTRTEAGEMVLIEGDRVLIPAMVDIGHKIARCDLKPGDKVVKQGARIGSMTAYAEAGDFVHIHNMKSDYCPPPPPEERQAARPTVIVRKKTKVFE